MCAQALCLEEMFASSVTGGALYYGTPRRRQDVAFSPVLRTETETLAARMQELYRARNTPRAAYSPKCEKCSLLASCMPKTLTGSRAVERYLGRALAGDGE